MRLFAYIRLDGSIEGLVAMPEGKWSASLVPKQGVEVCEIVNHGIQDEDFDPDRLREIYESHTVKVTPAHGKFVPRKQK